MTDTRLDDLRHRLPSLQLSTDAGDLEFHGRDWTRRWTPAPLAVAFPASAEDVVEIVRWANVHAVGLVPSGGRTGLSGGAVAAHGELVVSLQKLNRVLDFDPVDRTLTVQAGITLEALQQAARGHGLQYPVDFASRGSCTIGGNIATNAGGIRVLRYGNTREWIAGLTLVTGSGEVLEFNRGLIKNSSGYDFRHLAIASEGTLGIVVAASVRLTDPAPPARTLLLALPDFHSVLQVFAQLRTRLSLQAFEFFTERALRHVLAHGGQAPFAEQYPFYVVSDVDAAADDGEAAVLAAFEACVEQGLVMDGAISQSDAQAAQLWRLREGITEALAPHLPYKNDVSVRLSAMPALLEDVQALLAREYPQFEVVWFGHIGDGNLHINVLKPAELPQADFVRDCERVTELLSTALQRHGGSISAEHGIGLVKKPYLQGTRSAAEIALMRKVKGVFDPNGVMNPGKLLD